MLASSAMILMAFTSQRDIKWNRGYYLGKTPSQIVAMGRVKWNELHNEKKGLSNHAMCEGERMFGDALQNVNNIKLRKIDSRRRNWLVAMRDYSVQYGSLAYDIGYHVTGGGTMWQLFNSSIHADVEEIIQSCLSNKKMPQIKMMSFELLLRQMDETLAKHPAPSPEDQKVINESRAKFGEFHKKATKLLSQASYNDSVQFRIFFNKKITDGSGKDLLEEN